MAEGKVASGASNPVNDDNIDEDPREMDFFDGEGMVVDGIRIPPAIKPTCSLDPTGPRLLITKIANSFFKSFAEEVILGPFHKYFNAIVGPNGSGKSNVIDSILFVFGYRATKIRSKKVSELIHHSENFGDAQSCSVSVHFASVIDKDGDEYDVVPGSEFVVSRIAYKDNSSHYQLNGRKVQFKEICVLLKKHGIDLENNRFLILQGEVEQIAMMKSKSDNEHESGMLEYLEDIIGTCRYKKPLGQLLERVEVLDVQRMEKLNRLSLVENELEELRGPMEEALKFLKTENIIVNCSNFLYQKKIRDLELKLAKANEDRNQASEVQNEFIEKLAKLHEEKVEKDRNLKKHAERNDKLQKKKDSATEALNKANNKNSHLQESIKRANKALKDTKEMIVDETNKLEKLGRTTEKNQESLEEYEAHEVKLSEKKEILDAERTKSWANLQNETKGLKDKKDKLQTDLIVLKTTVNETRSEFALTESELKIYMSNEETEKAKYEDIKKVYENAQSTIEERSRQVAVLKKKIPATEASLREAKQELDAVGNREAQILGEVRKNRVFLEEHRNSMQASRSQGKVLDSLMQQKREGNCPGLYGRLGDLGAIDQKYDVAISTACGPLDNIVVDNVDTAEWCIEFLRKYDLGRATFIALNRQEHLRDLANSKITTPENVHRLFDLVRIQDEDVRTAFYYALRDTLVAKDLDQACRIAYGTPRFRVVTLGGELIETTGTMSGGGTTVSRGRMGQSVRVTNVDPRELDNLEENIQHMEQEVRDLRQKSNQLERQINTLEPELRQMKFDLEKFTMELKGLQQHQPQLAKQVKQQEAKSKAMRSDPVRVKQLTAVLEGKRAAYEAAEQTAGVLQAQVDEITDQIEEKTARAMKAVEKNINEVTVKTDKCRAEITRLKVVIRTAERNRKKSAETTARLERKVVNLEDELRRMKEERSAIEDTARLSIFMEEITEQLTEIGKAYTEIKKEVAELTKRENKLKLEKLDADEKMKTCQLKINEFKGAIHQLKVKLSHLKLQDIPNETVLELKQFTEEEIQQRDEAYVEKELRLAKSHLNVAKPNLGSIAEYQSKHEVYEERSTELMQVTAQQTEMRKLYDNLRTQRRKEFLAGFNIIRMKLKEMYQMLTIGGGADLELIDSYDPFTEGVEFTVRPPKKTWKKISNLSGGEKTLSSLALVFALHYYKPSPLYVMDEIDASLDFKNVSIVGHYIKECTKNAQFIIISLRPNMFELGDRLIGIYKHYNTTQTITVDPKAYDQQETATMSNDNAVSANTAVEHEKENSNDGDINKDVNGGKAGEKNNEENVADDNLESSKSVSSPEENCVVAGPSNPTGSSNRHDSEDLFDNLESSKSVSFPEENCAVRAGPSNPTGSSNCHDSENMDLSGDSQEPSNDEIEASYTSEEMEVDG